MFETNVYQARRQKLKQQVGKGLILLLGNEESPMNYTDNLYPFRQDSSFLYFFGLDKPGLAGVIDIDNDQEIIYGRDLTMDEIVWTGPQPSLAGQASAVGIDVTRPVTELTHDIIPARTTGRNLHFLPPYRSENSLKLSGWLGVAPGSLKQHASVLLIKASVAQRSTKPAEEIVQIEEAVNPTADLILCCATIALISSTEA